MADGIEKTNEPVRLVMVNAGVSDPSTTRLLADRIAQSTLDRSLSRMSITRLSRGQEVGGDPGWRLAGLLSVILAFRGTRFRPEQLMRLSRTLAVVRVRLKAGVLGRVPDCTDPSVLMELGLRPDALAHHDRSVTQRIARDLYTRGHSGLRWWSSLTGAWHTTILFQDRIRADEIAFEEPEHLDPRHAAVVAVLPILGIRPD